MPSPEYVARNAKLPDTPGVCVNVVPSATPPASVNALDVAAAGAVQVPLVNHENVTVPVGVGSQPGRSPSPGRAPSCPPAPTSPSHAPRCGSPSPWSTRPCVDRQRLTRPGRAGVDGVTRYVARNAKLPDTLGVCVNVVPSATPPASVNAPDVAAAGAVQVAVGEPRERHRPRRRRPDRLPVTVAWSCTIVPAGTDVTVACAALWITVAVDRREPWSPSTAHTARSSRRRCASPVRSPGTRSSPPRRASA